MNEAVSAFLDANVLIYLLDETAEQHTATITALQKLLDEQGGFYTSHHVIEEVLFIVSKLAGDKQVVVTAIQKIAELPGLDLVEPPADLDFAERYVRLWQKTNLGINDALLLQIMLEAGIDHIFTYDTELLKQARKLGIRGVVGHV